MPELNFDTHNTLYATHGLHPYAAKCPPQLVNYAIRYYSKPGEVVLDPMAGSGTTLVESSLTGRGAQGYEIDPLARLITRVKCQPLNDERIELLEAKVIQKARRDLNLLQTKKPPFAVIDRATPPEFYNRDYWFGPKVAESLSLLSFHINETAMPYQYRDFFWVAFSSLILAKKSVANARDIIHSRHHYYKHLTLPDVLDRFERRIGSMRRQAQEYKKLRKNFPDLPIWIRSGDARQLTIDDCSVDLVFTSPPYATALDYPRAHFLAVAWMKDRFGITLEQYKKRASKYIGGERGVFPRELIIDASLIKLDLTRSIIEKLEKRSKKHALRVNRYFSDMYKSLKEMHRVLKTGRHIVIVVCPSHIRKLQVPTHEVFSEMGANLGLKFKYQHRRTINKRKRLLPYMREEFGNRMNTEYVLVLKKL